MKKSNAKLPLKAIDIAMNRYAEKECKKQGLSKAQTNKILSSVEYEEPYVNLAILKSGQLYKTAQTNGLKIKNQIKKIAEDNNWPSLTFNDL